MRARLPAIALCVGLATACSNKNDHPGSPVQDSGPPIDSYIDTYAPDTRVDAPDATADATGEVADGSDASDTADAGDTYEPPPDGGPPLCPESSAWSTSTLVPSASTTDSDLLGSITPDELSIAWTASTGSLINYADRSASTDAFGTSKTIDASGYALERVALSPDGLRLVAVTLSRKGFVQMTRAKRGDAFGTATADAFSVINATTGETGFVGDPVIAGDDKTFFYSYYGPSGMADTIRKSSLGTGGVWVSGTPMVDIALKAVADKRKRPTGISKDLRTLFVTDESTGNAIALWSPAVGWSFLGSRNLGVKVSVQPSGDCTKIYFSAPASDAGSSLDIFYAK